MVSGLKCLLDICTVKIYRNRLLLSTFPAVQWKNSTNPIKLSIHKTFFLLNIHYKFYFLSVFVHKNISADKFFLYIIIHIIKIILYKKSFLAQQSLPINLIQTACHFNNFAYMFIFICFYPLSKQTLNKHILCYEVLIEKSVCISKLIFWCHVRYMMLN